jgi:hypothetical protein
MDIEKKIQEQEERITQLKFLQQVNQQKTKKLVLPNFLHF